MTHWHRLCPLCTNRPLLYRTSDTTRVPPVPTPCTITWDTLYQVKHTSDTQTHRLCRCTGWISLKYNCISIYGRTQMCLESNWVFAQQGLIMPNCPMAGSMSLKTEKNRLQRNIWGRCRLCRACLHSVKMQHGSSFKREGEEKTCWVIVWIWPWFGGRHWNFWNEVKDIFGKISIACVSYSCMKISGNK